MRICFVGPASSQHIVKWCNWFSLHGHEVHVVSFLPGEIVGAQLHLIDIGVNPQGGDAEKLRYLTSGRSIRRLISQIQPDIVNAHYATSYGIAMALSGIRRYIVSVWGADVYDFPRKSPLHKALLEFSLKKATMLFSTSRAMAEEAHRYTGKDIEITPFGVDTELFSKNSRLASRDNDGCFIVGTIKGLSDKYGIADILRAVAEVRKKRPDIRLQLRIAGKGPQEEEYHCLARSLGIDDITTWLGFISQNEAAVEWANMDVAVIPSTLESESFGVSAVEAQACGVPVIISDIPGLMEATYPEQTSIVVRREHPEEIADALCQLHDNPALRYSMGEAGRAYVLENYEVNRCFKKVESLYNAFIR